MFRSVLLVDVAEAWLKTLRAHLNETVAVATCVEFRAARERLLATRPAILVTNTRLGAYNGLHLVYLALSAGLQTRSIVYGDSADLSLAREARSVGAFFETTDHIAYALPSFVESRFRHTT
jgi:DNA-binding NtrC family response regulator